MIRISGMLGKYLPVLLFLLMGNCYLYSQRFNEEVEAKIDLETNGDFVELSGSALNKTTINRSLRYVLSTIVTDSLTGKKIIDSKEGRFILEPYGQKSLLTTIIEKNSDNRTIILLLIYEQDKIIGKDRKLINGIEGEENQKPILLEEFRNQDIDQEGEDGVYLKGLVVENTKTKAGRDFYNLFYALYVANKIEGEKIVEITEALAIGNNTRIEIRAGEDVVVQFILNPRQDYLKTMAERSIFSINNYFQKLKETKNQLIRY